MRRIALVALLALTAAAPAAAQLMAGMGPAFPSGDFNGQHDANTGVSASARIGLSVLLVALQLEATYARFTVADLQDVARRPVSRIAAGPTVALHFIRVGTVRPYALAGVSFGPRRIGEGPTDTSWRFATHIGAGVDLDLGPAKPFVELRYVSSDAPGRVRDTYVPVLVGLRLF